MRKKLTYLLCAILLLAGFFGLCAISESSLPLWEGLGVIFAIGIAELPVVIIANQEALEAYEYAEYFAIEDN